MSIPTPRPLLAALLCLVPLSPALVSPAVASAVHAPCQDDPAPAAGPQDGAGAQDGPPTAPGQGGGGRMSDSAREAMWPAPTAEDWRRPCAIEFQRNWDDAVRLSQETGKPILICVNMDGEIASEHYAGIRYRDPEIAKLYEPYVCVIASVYRHTPRDHDEHGNRIECPRFGNVTCSEHIWIEPILYEKYFEGVRVAPRHIMVELDGQETYDVYYAFDTDSVFAAIEEGVAGRPPYDPPPRGDRSLAERVASADVRDRTEIEQAFRDGDADTRRAILQAALAAGDQASVDLLRLGVFGLDVDQASVARQALAETNSTSAVDLIADALRVPMDDGERRGLVSALDRLADRSPRAQTLSVVYKGLDQGSASVDAEAWSQALDQAGGAEAQPLVREAVEQRLDSYGKALAGGEESAESLLAFAEATLALAVDPGTAVSLAADRRTARTFSRLQFEDARRAAREAAALGAEGWRLEAVQALSNYYLGDRETAYTHAEAAAKDLPAGAYEWNAMAVLAIFAEARQTAIADARRRRQPWPPEWVSDVHAAYSILARHPLGTDAQVVAYVDFLSNLGATLQAERAIRQGLTRFPTSWDLHDRLRGRLLADHGVEALEREYVRVLDEVGATQDRDWFVGYTAMVTAEFHRRKAEGDAAWAAYERAMAAYERAAEARPETRDSCDHYVAMALAGGARIALEQDELDLSLERLLASFERREQSAATFDGLTFSAVSTAQMLRAALMRAQREEPLRVLQAALDALDPKLLERPEWDRGGAPSPDARRARRGASGGGDGSGGGNGGGGR